MASRNGAAAAVEDGPVLELQRITRAVVDLRIEGQSPLIVHKWSEKARKEMRDAQTGKARQKKAPKDPELEFEGARYRLLDGRDGLPAVAFKSAIVQAARYFEKLTLVELKQWIIVEGQPGVDGDLLVAIDAGPPRMREDMVRVGQGVADLRYRPEYDPWAADLRITYPAQRLSADSILALVDAAGIGGVGEWRPSSPKGYSGVYGRFHVVEV